MKRLIPWLLMLLLAGGFSAQAQIYSFSKDPSDFTKEMKKFFKDYKQQDVQDIVNKFLLYVSDGTYTPKEFLTINATCNVMLQRQHMKPIPHFRDYLQIMVAYKEHNIEPQKFDQYDIVYNTILSKSRRDANEFNDAIYSLFAHRAIYTSVSKSWYIYTNFYSIEMEKRKPVIVVKNAISLTCLTRQDTLAIHNTTGKFYPLEYKWVGSKGQVNWRRVEEDSTQVYALIQDYSLKVKDAKLVADSVTFYNKHYFSRPLFGRLQDKALTTYNGKNAHWPWFRSYKAVYILDKLSKNILYIGGFTQEGLRIMGTSSMDEFGPKQYAKVYVSYKGEKTLKAESDVFQIDRNKIVASNARTTIYFEGDSFYHPKIKFNYNVESRKVVLTRGDEGMYRSPMFDTYHDIEMEFDQLEWDIDYPQMDLRMFRGSEASALFVSKDYFTMNEYIRSQGVLPYHPVRRVVKFAKYVVDTNVFSVTSYAGWARTNAKSLEPLLIRLTMDGFIIWDRDKNEIIVRDKAFHYENAAQARNDYDFLRLESYYKKENAQFSLNTGNLLLEGVGKIMLSDTHRVFIYPRNQKVVMKKDRNFEFAGFIRAGLFEFYGNTFFFDYQNFTVQMDNIDSLRMYVRMDPAKPTLVAQIQSVLQNVSGTLYVDQPANKSGKINYPEYPIFKCTKNAFVYYDKKHILGGNYKRDRFYFNIKPFTVDSLDKFYMDGLEFDGTFVSGDILPTFDYKLVPQPDLSLGLTKKDIFPLYVGEEEAGKGKGDLVINLSNKGLRGKGQIEYLTSITVSEDFIFYLDSMRSYSSSFNIEHAARGIYPKVEGKDVFTRWLAYKDSMVIEKLETPFKIFELGLEFSGDLTLTPERLTSSGSFNYKESIIKSKLFEFTPTHLISKSAKLTLKSDMIGTPAFVADDADLDLDVVTEITKGKSNSARKKILFPANKYTTSLKLFTWYSKDFKVEIEKAEDQPDRKSFFMSTKRGQDSLLFQSKFATYNLKDYKIYVDKIPYIASADAWIYPDKGSVTIDKDAFMESLKNAKVDADSTHKYHQLYDGLINVFGKYKFTGYASYDYIDKFKKKQKLLMHQIRIDDDNRMYAKGNVHDTIKFFIHPRFRFGGYIQLNSTIKEPDFDGHIKAYINDTTLTTFWVEFHDRVNADSVYLRLNQPKGDDGRELFTGIYVGTDSPYVYNVFLGKLKHQAHPAVFAINDGVLYYNDKQNKFVYSDIDKEYEGSMRGAYFTYSTETHDIYSEGRFDFGENIKAMDVKSAGNVNYDAETGKYLFHCVMMIDFPFDDKALNKMTDILIENTYFKKDARENDAASLKAISELIDDEKERNNMIEEIQSYGLYKPSKNFSSTLILTNLQLTYNKSNRMFESEKSELGLSSVLKTEIHKGIDGGVQITKRRSGTILGIYLQTDENNYYFFKYNYGLFNVLSSDPEFNEMVVNTASKNSAPKYRIKKGSNRDLLRLKKDLHLY